MGELEKTAFSLGEGFHSLWAWAPTQNAPSPPPPELAWTLQSLLEPPSLSGLLASKYGERSSFSNKE